MTGGLQPVRGGRRPATVCHTAHVARPSNDPHIHAGAPVDMQRLLDRVVRSMGAPGTDAVELVFNRWDEVVGTVLASRTRPAGLEKGRLVLIADDPAVVSHVRWLEAELISRLDELLGAGRVSGIDVRVTPQGRRGRTGRRPDDQG